MTWLAFVWELQYIVAKLIFEVFLASAQAYLISRPLPHPPGPTTAKFMPAETHSRRIAEEDWMLAVWNTPSPQAYSIENYPGKVEYVLKDLP